MMLDGCDEEGKKVYPEGYITSPLLKPHGWSWHPSQSLARQELCRQYELWRQQLWCARLRRARGIAAGVIAPAGGKAPAGPDFGTPGPDFEAAGTDFKAAGPDFEAAGPNLSVVSRFGT